MKTIDAPTDADYAGIEARLAAINSSMGLYRKELHRLATALENNNRINEKLAALETRKPKAVVKAPKNWDWHNQWETVVASKRDIAWRAALLAAGITVEEPEGDGKEAKR